MLERSKTLEIKSEFIAESNGKPKITKRTRLFFSFLSRTEIKISTGSIVIRTNRRMARALEEYFLDNKDFQSKVLAENERNAVRFFQNDN